MSNVVINPYNFAAAGFPNTYSLEFDGIDDYVDCGDSSFLDGSDTLTISAWVNPGSIGLMDIVRRKQTYGGDIYLMIWPEYDRISFGVFNNGVTTYSVTLNVGTWYHLFCCYNRSLNNGKDFIIFLDGIEVAAVNGNVSIPVGVDPLKIGKNHYPCLGNIDEVAIWNTDQRANVSDIYSASGAVDLSALAAPPNFWYRMGDKVTNFPTIPDQIGSNDGTAYNENEATMVVPDVPA